MLAHQIEHQFGTPEKHAGIPEEIPAFDTTLRGPRVRLLAKAGYLQRIGRARLHIFRKFDIAVSCLRPARLNPEHHDPVLRSYPIGSLHKISEAVLLENEMV